MNNIQEHFELQEMAQLAALPAFQRLVKRFEEGVQLQVLRVSNCESLDSLPIIAARLKAFREVVDLLKVSTAEAVDKLNKISEELTQINEY